MKLDMRQTCVESCALDEEGYMHRRGGEEHERVKERVPPTELGRYKTEKERKIEFWARIKRV